MTDASSEGVFSTPLDLGRVMLSNVDDEKELNEAEESVIKALDGHTPAEIADVATRAFYDALEIARKLSRENVRLRARAA